MNRILTYFVAAFALLTACTSEKELEEVEDISGSTDAMRFTGTSTEEEEVHNSRASRPLTTGFAVSAYKAYLDPAGKQQIVMQDYRVDYRVDGWNNNSLWEYAGVQGFTEKQYTKFWDYANFPYRFHAIAPCPERQTDFVLSDQALDIKVPYYYQTCVDGLVSTRDAAQQLTAAAAEPHLIAQVQRATDGTDKDIFNARAINTATTIRNRDVWMPFHHVNAKIRFGIYSTFEWTTYNRLYVEDLVVNVTSPNFVTTAAGYKTDGTASWRNDNGFYGTTSIATAAEHTTPLFAFSGGESVEGNDLRDHQGQSSAYMLLCTDGFVQIPQKNVQMSVSFKLMDESHNVFKEYVDVPIEVRIPDGSLEPLHTWQSGYLHTYYLVLGGLPDKLEVFFTATLSEWEDITGQLETDLEK